MPIDFFHKKQTPKQLRSKKLEQVLADAVNQVLSQELEMPDETMISITKAKLNESLTYLDLTVSAYGTSSIEEVLEFLESKHGYIKAYCSKKVHLKYMPEIRFHADKSIEETLKWDNLNK